jgi:hypothetical protein
MKKTVAYCIGFCILVSLVSCVTTKKPAYTVAAVANIDPFSVGKVPAGINQFLASDIAVKDIAIVYDPRQDVVNLEFSNQAVKHSWSLTKEVRKAFIADVAQYKADFEAKGLTKEVDHKAYGLEHVFVQWGIMRFNGEADAKIQVGYKFIDSAPYFTLILPVTENALYQKFGESVPRSSSYIALHFTRAQATEFVSHISEEYLAQKLAEKNVSPKDLPTGQDAINAPDVY